MNNDDKDHNTVCKENNLASNGSNNKGVTSLGSCGSGGVVDSHYSFSSSMGPNHQYQGHNKHNDKMTAVSRSTGNSSNTCHSNGGGNNSFTSNNNSANGNSNGGGCGGNSSLSNFSPEVCRDFLRNVCRRGVNCRYRHPEGSEAEELGKKVDLIFCHDYQNKECRRSNCRFIHCTKQEEEIYRATGKIPNHLIEKSSYSRLTASSSPSQSGSFHHHHSQQHHSSHHQHQHQHQQHHHHPQQQHQHQEDFMNSVICDNSSKLDSNNAPIANNLASSLVSSLASSLSSSLTSSSASYSTMASPFPNPIPVCKDNLKGDCLRGVRCKFRHITQSEYDLEIRGTSIHSSGGGATRTTSIDRNSYHHHHGPLPLPVPGSLLDGSTSYQGGLAPPEPKRRAYDNYLGFGPQPPFNQSFPPNLPQRASSSSLNHPGLPPSIAPFTPSNEFEFPKPSQHPSNLFNSRFIEDENFTLRRHIEELKKKVADLMASNEFLIEQNAQLRTLGTRSTTPLPSSSLHSGKISATYSNDSFIGSRPSDLFNPQQQHFPVSLSTGLSTQTTGASVPVSSMAALSTNVMSDSTNPLVSYPIMASSIQSLRPTTVPNSLSH